MKKGFVLFSMFFSIYFLACGAIASELMALNTDKGTDVFVRELPTQKSNKLGIIWGSEFYGQSFIKPTGKTDGEWIQIESIYFGWPVAIKPEVKYGWVHGKYFRPSSPKEEGYIFFQPTNYKIYGGINIHETPNILDVSDFSFLNLATRSVFSMIGAKYVRQENEWIEIEPTGLFTSKSGYVLADFFGIITQEEVISLEKPERYNLVTRYVYSRKEPDIRGFIEDVYQPRGIDIYIMAKKGPWMQTVKGDWIFHQLLEKFPLCLL
jgi:hypothetical protein